MTILVVGATGATGRLLVEQLLDRGHQVRAVVRSPEKLSGAVRDNPRLTLICASILDLTEPEIVRHTGGCDAVASCLGHTLSLRGIYGQPRRLVTETTRRLCTALRARGHDAPAKFVLLITAGNSNRDLDERISFAQRLVLGLLRRVLPPHADNESAADFLRTEGPRWDGAIEWTVVRPDTLIDEPAVSGYTVHPSPTRSALFNPGRTSRINVAHFMADLFSDEGTWNRWKGKMPVLYNTT
jgi:nucleoside-diphosphate-sugar epimerase